MIRAGRCPRATSRRYGYGAQVADRQTVREVHHHPLIIVTGRLIVPEGREKWLAA